MRASLVLVVALGVGSLVPSRAVAADPAADVEEAREKFTRAIKAQNAGRWDEALTLLRQVAAVKTTPQVRFNIALCEENLGQLVQALDDYAEAAKAARAEDAEKVAYEADSRRSVLEQRVPRITIRLGASHKNASVVLDGKPLEREKIGQPILLDPGAHLVEASAPGAPAFKKNVKLAEGSKEEIVVDVDVAPPRRRTPKPAPEPPKRSILPFVVGGVGAASLVASGVFFLLRQGTIGSLDDKCGADRDACPESERDTYDRGKTYNLLTNVTLAVGVVGVGAGVALYVLGSPKERTGAAFVPAAPASLGGASLIGHF